MKFSFIYSFAFLLFLVGCKDTISHEQAVSSEKPELNYDRDLAAAHYSEYCAGCHGAELRTFVDRDWVNGNSLGELVGSITRGSSDHGMVAFDSTFTKNEIEGLARYILDGIKEVESEVAPEPLSTAYCSTEDYELRVEEIVSDIEVPWGIKVREDGTMFFTERRGTLKIRRPNGLVNLIGNVPTVKNRGQGGMMDVALHPDFDNNQILYLSYSKIHESDDGLYTTAVVRAKLSGYLLEDVQEIFEARPYASTRHHYGSRLVFDNDGYLYVSVGDRGNRDENPQNVNNSCGKIHRINDDGSIPEDNPFVRVKGAVTSIWTYGNRNPQGMAYDSEHDLLWANEHGPKGGDEINLLEPGANYGWPVVSFGRNYTGTKFTDLTEKEGMNNSLTHWTPSIAPSGMCVVSGPQFEKWKGDLLSGSLKFNFISRVTQSDGTFLEEEKILEDIGRVRSIEMGADDYIYVGVEDPGRIFRIGVRQNDE